MEDINQSNVNKKININKEKNTNKNNKNHKYHKILRESQHSQYINENLSFHDIFTALKKSKEYDIDLVEKIFLLFNKFTNERVTLSDEKNKSRAKDRNKYNIDVDMIKNIYEIKEIAKSTNLISRNNHATAEAILEKLNRIANLLENIANNNKTKFSHLTTVDEQILEFVRERGMVCAEDVQKKFKYKGKNAASARLNNLFRKEMLKKMRIGKKTFFKILEN